MADHSAGFGANQLQRIRVLLLGHQTASRAEAVVESREGKLFCRVKDQVFRQATQMRGSLGSPVEKIHDKVPIARSRHAVEGDGSESHVLGEFQTIDVEGIAGDGAGAERRGVDVAPHPIDGLIVAQQEPTVTHQPVTPSDWLRALQMRVPDGSDVNATLA